MDDLYAFPPTVLSMIENNIAEIKAENVDNDQPLKNMPSGAVSETETMHARAHRSADNPFIVMYNALNID
ncbi:hypothetical protein N6G94_01510 [Pediococcus inopinatus]|uniref:hypothetical protein n=1 Tax=Pediococcus inopinatus TaxID=114090 RepID=UPI002B263BEF|nr:hypothetical protein [Pediococcus inopinatus]WPC17729.1 hypothetical protein N6G94_01510 [Pediococcus inopinatus]